MPSLYSTLFVSLVSSSALAFLLLMLVLHKGELCPGQTGRIQRQLSTLVSFITLAALSGYESQQAIGLVVLVFISAFLGWVLSFKLNKLKHKRSLPLTYWWAMGAPLLLSAAYILSQHALMVFSFAACAAAMANWLMVKAKHRLTSFDKLLPFVGLAAAMVSLICVCIYLLTSGQLDENSALVKQFVIMSALLLTATLLWLVPLFKKSAPPAQLLLVVTVLSFISSVNLHKIVA
ncbi:MULTISPECIES: hypothetical protein [unclassified Agarivorans]|uniref:hypothetical protein n=1 Tax=unclassified Agarivorans TaxID=2636026 RepID=UPI0026E47D2E|nr:MULTISPECIES: hypothetical protein [unclassified Agarivorans]MDO6687981.1 hypothetical protein [Agarivorans sp. 3_MG-2023]MDO6717602.1 hypothetical protein [Agarivorans sp. 2_MG-2023]